MATALRSSTVSEPVEDAVLFMVHYLQEVQGPKHVVGRDFVYIAATPEARRLFLCTGQYLFRQVCPPGSRLSVPSKYIAYVISALWLQVEQLLAVLNVVVLSRTGQILREAELTVTNFHDLLSLLCSDFQLRVVKSAFKAAWVVLRGTQAELKKYTLKPVCCPSCHTNLSLRCQRALLCHAERPRTHTPRLAFDKFWKALELTWLYEPYFLSVRRYVFDSDSHRGAD